MTNQYKKIIVGFDVGLTGAMAAITECGSFVDVWDMPLQSFGVNGKKRVDSVALATLLDDLQKQCEAVVCIVEQVAARPQQSGMFSFGDSFGAVRSVVALMGLPCSFVTPPVWKKAAGLRDTEKDAARLLAIELFPDAPLTRKKDGGRADALLIARFGG